MNTNTFMRRIEDCLIDKLTGQQKQDKTGKGLSSSEWKKSCEKIRKNMSITYEHKEKK